MSKDDMRTPRIEAVLSHIACFLLRKHEPVAIVIVACVVLVEERRHYAFVGLSKSALIPFLYIDETIRIGARHQQQYHVVQNTMGPIETWMLPTGAREVVTSG